MVTNIVTNIIDMKSFGKVIESTNMSIMMEYTEHIVIEQYYAHLIYIFDIENYLEITFMLHLTSK